MVTFFKNMIALALLGVILVSSNAFAGLGGQPTRPCAHQYRTCLAPCNQMYKDAQAARRQCELNAMIEFPNDPAARKNAIAACRLAYAQAMQAVVACKAECKRQYDQCIGGQYD